MLRRHVESMHFRSSDGAGLHNVTGQGGATGHAAGARVRNVHVHGGASEHALALGDVLLHRCGGCQRWQKLPSNCPCGHQSVPCSVRLARATGHPTPQLHMQISLGDVHANAISLLAHINLLGVSVSDVWKKRRRPHRHRHQTLESVLQSTFLHR